MKRCSNPDCTVPVEGLRFYTHANTADKLRPDCVVCVTARRVRNHLKDPSIRDRSRRARVARRREAMLRAKGGACTRCSDPHPHYVLEFHHRDPASKLANVSELVNAGTMRQLLAEIAKCDVLCANCHRAVGWEAPHAA